MDYYAPLMQNQQTLNLMQSMQYQQLLQPDIGPVGGVGGGNQSQQQQQQSTEPWEQHDKHVSSSTVWSLSEPSTKYTYLYGFHIAGLVIEMAELSSRGVVTFLMPHHLPTTRQRDEFATPTSTYNILSILIQPDT